MCNSFYIREVFSNMRYFVKGHVIFQYTETYVLEIILYVCQYMERLR